MKTLDRTVIYTSAFIVVVCSVSTSIQARAITNVQQSRLSVTKAINTAQAEMAASQDLQLKAILKQLKAEQDRANAQSEEMHYLKLELDELRRSRAGLMRLFDILNPKVKIK